MSPVKPIPEGMHTVTPVMVIKGCSEAMDFYTKAFGAQIRAKAMDPSGKMVWHGVLSIGDSSVFLSDEMREMGGPAATPAQLWLYVENVEQAFQRAVQAGCQVTMPLADQFWGDRFGKLKDKWGNEWSLAQKIKDLTPEQIQKAQDEFVASMKQKR
jgi:PhnB protein